MSLIRDGREQPLHSKVANMRLQKGDIIRLVTSGGGGLGHGAERSQAAQARDTELGYTQA